MPLPPASDVAVHLEQVREHVLYAAADPQTATKDLARLLSTTDALLAQARITAMRTNWACWTGTTDDNTISQSRKQTSIGAPLSTLCEHSPPAPRTKPADSTSLDGPTADSEANTLALQAAAELLRGWAQQRDRLGLLTPHPTLTALADWLRHGSGVIHRLGGNTALDNQLSALRARARTVQHDPNSTPKQLESTLAQVKSSALRAAGGTLDGLLTQTLQREALNRLGATLKAFDPHRLRRTASELTVLSAPATSDTLPATRPSAPVTPPEHEHLARLRPSITGWDEFAARLHHLVVLDLEPRTAKRTTAACLPLHGGCSVILACFDNTHQSTASVLHETAHAFLYWTLSTTPELARPSRAVDEQIALDAELRLHLAWMHQLPHSQRPAYAHAVEERWHAMLAGTAQRLAAEIELLQQLATATAGSAAPSDLGPHSAPARFPQHELRANPHLFEEELAPARYLFGAANALHHWAPETSYDHHSRTQTSSFTTSEKHSTTAAVQQSWQRYRHHLRNLTAPSIAESTE